MSDYSLADYGHRVSKPPGRSLTREGVSWVLVALVHVVFLTIFVLSEVLPQYITRQPAPIETTLLLSMMPNAVAPVVRIIRPDVPAANAPVITTAPQIVVPPEPTMIQPETPEDILREIGEELACGASSYENLTQTARANCRHAPWMGGRLPNGVIVLVAPPKPAVEQEIHVSGADQLHRDLETGPSACPVLQAAPCLINGNGMKPP